MVSELNAHQIKAEANRLHARMCVIPKDVYPLIGIEVDTKKIHNAKSRAFATANFQRKFFMVNKLFCNLELDHPMVIAGFWMEKRMRLNEHLGQRLARCTENVSLLEMRPGDPADETLRS